ncbi:hypothetical protein E0Z10_g7537 [Xylaria hypoxylon]|uniref:Uncharacterized protein n=1 Tax=Xylaria hypoxylon TaxID=37992 RepID=A0A4Z0YME4_9PEZI|nr:hypothetical protein E0Z10_g7537 [Xylaria hypoxylon]
MKNEPDENVVYMALRNVFEGRNATVRQLKTVRKLIVEAAEKDAEVSNLANIYDIGAISRVARRLLVNRSFESTLNARIHFPVAADAPDAVDASSAQGADRGLFGAGAAIDGANAIAGAVEGGSENLQGFISQVDDSGTESFDTHHNSNPSTSKLRRSTIRSRSSVCIPMKTQDRILTQVQRLLEKACFDFGRRVMPEVLEMRQWDCPEAAELNNWVPEFRIRQRELFGPLGDMTKPHDQLLRSMADLRHMAVHRIRINARRLELFLLNAEKFTALLGDATRREMLAKLRLNTQEVIGKLEYNRSVIGSKRAELDRVREMGIAELQREESEYQVSAAEGLEEALEEALAPSVAPTPVVTAKEDEMSFTVNEADLMEDDNRSSRSD